MRIDHSQVYKTNKHSPSCKMLKHRNQNFQTKLREYKKSLQTNEYEEFINTKSYVKKNLSFVENNFLDDFVTVKYTLDVTPSLKKYIDNNNFEHLFISIFAGGVKLSQSVINHRQLFDVDIQFSSLYNKLLIQFEVSTHEYCQSKNSQPLISWLPESVKNKYKLIKSHKGEPGLKLINHKKSIFNNKYFLADMFRKKALNELKNLINKDVAIDNFDKKLLANYLKIYFIDISKKVIFHINTNGELIYSGIDLYEDTKSQSPDSSPLAFFQNNLQLAKKITRDSSELAQILPKQLEQEYLYETFY